jgi:cob(I)alamin adenosyltransferase
VKIYTRKGDGGETSLIGGTRVPKHHLRVEAYGTVDELNSWIGLVRDQSPPADQEATLLAIQERLFTIGACLASDPERSKMAIPDLVEADVVLLEEAIDAMESGLEPLQNFVLPGGHPAVSQAHVARCVCRRAERQVVHLSEASEVDERIPTYLNRLSDYLFVLCRAIAKQQGVAEIPWKPRA